MNKIFKIGYDTNITILKELKKLTTLFVVELIALAFSAGAETVCKLIGI